MRIGRLPYLYVLLSAACLAAGDPPATGQATSKHLDLDATLYNGKADVESLLGQQIGEGIVVVAVRVVPKSDTPVKIWRDDFFLRSDKDGQRSEPYEPSQIAGGSVMSVGQVQQSTGTVMVEDQGPVWGGVGGGRPRRMGGSGGGIGNATTGAERTEAQLGNARSEPQSKLLALLNEKVLPEGEISQPVSGLLYFPLEGKHKVKQLELHYRGEAGKLDVRFLPKKAK
jgi:hypothetical protein